MLPLRASKSRPSGPGFLDGAAAFSRLRGKKTRLDVKYFTGFGQ